MKLSAFESAVKNNPKFTGLSWRKDQTPFPMVGFRLARSNSFVYYNFTIWGNIEPDDEVTFDHTYSANTGKTSRGLSKHFNVLKELGYFDEDLESGKLTKVAKSDCI